MADKRDDRETAAEDDVAHTADFHGDATADAADFPLVSSDSMDANTTDLNFGPRSGHDDPLVSEDDLFVTQHFGAAEAETPRPDLPDGVSLGDLPTVSMSQWSQQVFREDDSRELGDFRLVNKLGSGGFGVVYRATDIRLDRDVAIKVIKPDKLGDAKRRENFQAEAKAVAQLRHPNIVPVHQAGSVSSGQAFIVYEFIDGPTLRGYMRKHGAFEIKDAVKLLVKIADGLGYAHQSGMVHRDVKPENILIEDSTGEPHIADFGCASQSGLVSESADELSGVFIGTPQYFSPEQAAGKSHLADAPADVWALGVVMDEMLTGRRTFREVEKTAETITDLLEGIQTTKPLPLVERCEKADLDLGAIWQKCMFTDPDQRYQSASDLAEDLRRWLRHEPVLARPLGRPERLVRWAKRNPTVAASLATVFTTVLMALIVTSFALRKATRENLAKSREAVERSVAVRPDAFLDSLKLIRSNSFRTAAASILEDEWKLVSTHLTEEPASPETAHRAWRLALDLAAVNGLDDVPDYVSGDRNLSSEEFLCRHFVSMQTSIPELEMACLAVKELPDSSTGIRRFADEWKSQLERNESAAVRLRALYALECLGRVPANASQIASQQLFAVASEDSASGSEWVRLLRTRFPDLGEQLSALGRDLQGRQSDMQVLEGLLMAVKRQPMDVLRQLFASDRPPREFLSSLKERLDETGETLDYDRMLEIAGGIEQLDHFNRCKLWIAHLYLTDVQADVNSLDPRWLRVESNADRSSETLFVCSAAENELAHAKLLAIAHAWADTDDVRLAPLLLALGDLSRPANLPASNEETLLRIWNRTAHAATHSACDWLLRQWQIATDASKLPTQYADEKGNRNWRMHHGRLTIRVKRPEEPFLVGTPADVLETVNPDLLDPKFNGYEVANLHQVLGDFEVSAFETTVAEFEQFLEERSSFGHLQTVYNQIQENRSKARASEAEVLKMPADGLNWYNAVEYCVWQSQRHDLESCYGELEDVATAFEKVKSSIACDRTKSGYRLPTNGEWELFCRSGTNTLWPHGDDDSLLNKYAAFENGGGQMLTVGSLRPNPGGFFDCLGNAAELTDSFSLAKRLELDEPRREVDSALSFFDLRGGTFFDPARIARSARRIATRITLDSPPGHPHEFGIGLRLVRSLPATDKPHVRLP